MIFLFGSWCSNTLKKLAFLCTLILLSSKFSKVSGESITLWRLFFCTVLARRFCLLLIHGVEDMERDRWFAGHRENGRTRTCTRCRVLEKQPPQRAELMKLRHAINTGWVVNPVLRIRDVYPGFWFLSIPDPGSNNSTKRGGEIFYSQNTINHLPKNCHLAIKNYGFGIRKKLIPDPGSAALLLTSFYSLSCRYVQIGV